MTTFSKNFLKQQKAVLEAKYAQYLKENHGTLPNIQVEQLSDSCDQAALWHEQALALKTLGDSAENISQIISALDAINKGIYGICLDCEESIAKKRLVAVPWAQRCVVCQEQFMTNINKQYDNAPNYTGMKNLSSSDDHVAVQELLDDGRRRTRTGILYT